MPLLWLQAGIYEIFKLTYTKKKGLLNQKYFIIIIREETFSEGSRVENNGSFYSTQLV